jgi:excisionase family DNA binding protein
MLPLFSEDLLNGADEAAKFTGLSRRTIYHLVEQNQIPFSRMGARLYFRKSALNISFGGLPPLEPLGHDNQNDRNLAVNA